MDTATPVRTLVLRAAAIVSIVAAVIHFAVAGARFADYWAFGVFMLVVAWLQLGWAVGVLVRPTRVLLALGGLLNAGVVGVYVVTRTYGDVIGPTPRGGESVGFGDAFCTGCGAMLVVIALLLLLRPMRQPVSRPWALGTVGAAGVAATVLLSVSLVAGGSEMVMGGDSAPAAALAAAQPMAGMNGGTVKAVSIATDSPAGPVTMPDASMQMMDGMQMVGGDCTAAPTAAQQRATAALVNTTWADNKKYDSLAAAQAAGFIPITPTGLPVVHYVSIANYVATLEGRKIVDPSAPQSLVYANTPAGAVLAAVMYIQPTSGATPPDPGGCLTQWHIHTNLCYGAGGAVVAITPPACPPGSVHRISTPMFHIWFAPIPGGPTAVDASDSDVVAAAEQLHGPHNGIA